MIEEPPSDLAELRQRYPGWRIAARWVTRPTGPDARTLIADPRRHHAHRHDSPRAGRSHRPGRAGGGGRELTPGASRDGGQAWRWRLPSPRRRPAREPSVPRHRQPREPRTEAPSAPARDPGLRRARAGVVGETLGPHRGRRAIDRRGATRPRAGFADFRLDGKWPHEPKLPALRRPDRAHAGAVGHLRLLHRPAPPPGLVAPSPGAATTAVDGCGPGAGHRRPRRVAGHAQRAAAQLARGAPQEQAAWRGPVATRDRPAHRGWAAGLSAAILGLIQVAQHGGTRPQPSRRPRLIKVE